MKGWGPPRKTLPTNCTSLGCRANEQRGVLKQSLTKVSPSCEAVQGPLKTLNCSARLRDSDGTSAVISPSNECASADFYLEFGPTAVVENQLVPEPVVDPDFTKIFVTRQAADGDGIDRIHRTDVRLDEILTGLGNDDSRLLESVLAICPP